MRFSSILSIGAMLFLASFAKTEDWPQFRGPAGTSVATTADIPSSWEAGQGIAWKLALPGQGWSQPITSGNLVFVTTAVSDQPLKPKGFMTGVMDPRSRPGSKAAAPSFDLQWNLHAIDQKTGKELWKRTVVTGKPKYPIHPSNSFATETPATNGTQVFVYFGATGTLACFDIEGKEKWKREFGTFPMTEGFGTGASLCYADGKVILQNCNEESSFITALDAESGSESWRVFRSAGSAWATPLLWKNALRSEVISCGRGAVISLDPQTGKELWKLGNLDTSFSSSPTASQDLLFFGNSAPGSSGPLYAVKAGAAGDITLKKGENNNTHVQWFKTGAGPGMPSPVVHNGLLYILGTGILNCYDILTGERLYRERLPKAASFAACPIVMKDKLLLLDENGQAFVVQTGRQFKVLATHALPKETYWASPALGNQCLLIRGTDHLYCIR